MMSCHIHSKTTATAARLVMAACEVDDEVTSSLDMSDHSSINNCMSMELLTPASTTCSGLLQGSPMSSLPDSSREDIDDDIPVDLALQVPDVFDENFLLPPPAVPLDSSEVEAQQLSFEDQARTCPDAASWSCSARLPQLRIRAFRSLPSHSPQRHANHSPRLSPALVVRRRSVCRAGDDSPASSPATRAQLREGATGAEDVLNRIRYDLMDASGFVALIDNVEQPPLCRPFLLRGECKYGQNCRYQHAPPVNWLSGSSAPLVSSGSHIAHVEEFDVSKLFALLDSAPSQTARHALIQTVAFVLYRGEVVWCRHIGRSAARQLWGSFLGTRLGLGTTAVLRSTLKVPCKISGASGGGPTQIAIDVGTTHDLMLFWPGNVWERVLYHLRDPCLIAAASTALLASSRGMRASCLVDDQLWELLARACFSKVECSVLPEVNADEAKDKWWRRYVVLSENLRLARLCWAACASGPSKPASQKQSPAFCLDASGATEAVSPHTHGVEVQVSGPIVRVEVGFEVSMLRANASLTVAASRKTNEVRLFQSNGLGRLPALRLKGRPGVDALDLAPEYDMLAAGGLDGRISLHSISDAGGSGHRIGRFSKPPNVCGDVPATSPLFAGFHFLPGSGAGQLLIAARLGISAQILDVSSEGKVLCESKAFGSMRGLIACDPLGGGSSAALLMNAGGSLRLWDIRMPSLLHVADLPMTSLDSNRDLALSVNLGEPAAAIVRGSTIYWADLRAGRLSEAQLPELWPALFRKSCNQPSPVRMVLARQGLVAAWFDGQTAPLGCWLGGGAALMPLMAVEATTAVTATTLPFGGGGFAPPFAVALARPSRRRRRLVYEVCAADVLPQFGVS
eukprot:TRINITY_DN43023_c0_g1_i1.p1 TRINITY_DN43023_c0_g1~~TRINITY_DN43023_c0_g1_i1.p1  ORF type:complete len:854 (-),score=133.34 TRINITY_DN43023_c0_g1_i1:255-2816(-)